MKNFEEIMSERKNRIEARKDELIRRSLLSEEFLEMIQKNKRPFDLLMSYYQCAVMEIETKFRVLNQEYSLEYDKNPIEMVLKPELNLMTVLCGKYAEKIFPCL